MHHFIICVFKLSTYQCNCALWKCMCKQLIGACGMWRQHQQQKENVWMYFIFKYFQKSVKYPLIQAILVITSPHTSPPPPQSRETAIYLKRHNFWDMMHRAPGLKHGHPIISGSPFLHPIASAQGIGLLPGDKTSWHVPVLCICSICCLTIFPNLYSVNLMKTLHSTRTKSNKYRNPRVDPGPSSYHISPLFPIRIFTLKLLFRFPHLAKHKPNTLRNIKLVAVILENTPTLRTYIGKKRKKIP